MANLARPYIVAVTSLIIALCACPFFTTPAVAELSDLTICRGWDAEENAIVLPDPVPPDETRICICGDFEANQDLYLQVFWYRERTNILSDKQVFSNGPFLACIEDDRGFEPGNYGVSVIMGKVTLALVEFTVGNSE